MNQTNAEPTVWAFDFGYAFIGEAVPVGRDFKHNASLLILDESVEANFAATKHRADAVK